VLKLGDKDSAALYMVDRLQLIIDGCASSINSNNLMNK